MSIPTQMFQDFICQRIAAIPTKMFASLTNAFGLWQISLAIVRTGLLRKHSRKMCSLRSPTPSAYG